MAAPSLTLTTVSDPKVVIPKTAFSCQFPDPRTNTMDGQPYIFRNHEGKLQIRATRSSAMLPMTASDFTFQDVTQSCTPFYRPYDAASKWNLSPNPARFNDVNHTMTSWTFDGKTVYGFWHNEFHGEDYKVLNDCGCTDGGAECWLASLVLFISRDGGYTYRPAATPPDHMIATGLYRFSPFDDIGNVSGKSGEREGHSNIIRNPRDGFFYLMEGRGEYQGDQRPGGALMRAPHPAGPWTYWTGGTDFSGRFKNPYREQVTEPAPVVTRGFVLRGIQYVSDFDTFVGTQVVTDPDGSRYTKYYTSPDLINWSDGVFLHEQIVADETILIDHHSSDRNFGVIEHVDSTFLYFNTRSDPSSEEAADQISRIKVSITRP